MKRTKSLQTIAAALLILTVAAPLTSAAANDPLLDMIPSDAVFCLRINQLNTSLAALDQFLLGASPIPLGMLVNMQLAGIVGDPALTGIDTNGTFMAVGIALPENSVDITILAPMADYSAFVANNPACSPSDVPGVTLLTVPDSPVGTLAIAPVPGGKYALVNTQEHIDAMLTLQKQLAAPSAKLSARLDAEQTAQATTAPAWLFVNMARLYDLYGPMMLGMIDGISAQMPPEAAMSAGELEINSRILTAMLQNGFGQADALTLALTPEPSILTMDVVFRAKDGSELAAMLVADPQAAKGFKLAGYADDAAAVNGIFKTNRILIEKLFEVIDGVMTDIIGDQVPAEGLAQMKTFMGQAIKMMGSETFTAFSYGSGQPPFMIRQVQDTNDPAFYKDMMPQGMALANALYEAMEMPLEFTHKPAVETYKNVAIDTFVISFVAEEDDPAAAIIKQMYGPDGMTYYVAQKENLIFTTFGPNAKNDIKSLIDTPAGKAPSGELQKAITLLGPAAQKADMVGSINLIKLAKGGLGMAQQVGAPAELLAPMAGALDIQTQSCMAASTTIANGKVSGRLALPKQHLMEIVAVAVQIQMQMMQAQSALNDAQ